MKTLAPIPATGGAMLKHRLYLTNPSERHDKPSTLAMSKIRDDTIQGDMRSMTLLQKKQDLALKKLDDPHRRSVTQLPPIEHTPKKDKEMDDENAPIVFNRDFGGSLSSKDLKNKMEDKDYLTPLDFIACCDRDPEFANRFCYCYRQGDFYDFRIVPFEKLKLDKERDSTQKLEYMTVSASGIVHF